MKNLELQPETKIQYIIKKIYSYPTEKKTKTGNCQYVTYDDMLKSNLTNHCTVELQ